VIIILAIVYSFSDFSFMNLIPRASLPDKYKSYREIQDGVVSATYRSELLFNSDNETRLGDSPPLFNAMNNTVIVTKRTELKKGESSNSFITYLKLNADGTVIDSLIITKDGPIDEAGYLITPHGYCSWILDGDKNIHPYAEQNEMLTEDSTTLLKNFKQLYQSSQFVYCYNHFEMYDDRLDSLQIDKALFYQHGRWIALFGKKLSDLDVQGYKTKDESQVNGMVNRINDQHIDKKNNFIYMDYFQKGHYDKGRGPSFGSPTGISSQDQWEGSAYFHIILKKDTLYLKQDMTKYDVDWYPANMSPYSPPAPIYYFTCAQLNFGVFTNNNYQLFLIRKKTK